MTDYMVQGLKRKRAELAGELIRTQERLSELVRDLETLDQAIRLIAPELDIPAIAPKVFRAPEDWSKRGEMSRMIFEVLRGTKQLMTSREIAAEIVTRRGLEATPQLMNLMTRRVTACLRSKRGTNVVKNKPTRGGWELQWQMGD